MDVDGKKVDEKKAEEVPATTTTPAPAATTPATEEKKTETDAPDSAAAAAATPPTVTLEPQVVTKVKRQIEYWFDTPNLIGDKFLKEQVASNEGGFVPIQVLTTFNKLKVLTTDIPAIAQAIEGSKLVELNADKTGIRRSTPLPDTWDPDPRTVHCSPIPHGREHEELTEFFSQWGTVQKVAFRGPGKDPKRQKPATTSCFVLMETVEQCQAIIDAKPKFADAELTVVFKAVFVAMGKGKDGDDRKGADRKPPGAELREFVPGSAVKIPNFPKDVGHKKLAGALGDYGTVRYIDVDTAADTAVVIFVDEVQRAKALEKQKETPLMVVPVPLTPATKGGKLPEEKKPVAGGEEGKKEGGAMETNGEKKEGETTKEGEKKEDGEAKGGEEAKVEEKKEVEKKDEEKKDEKKDDAEKKDEEKKEVEKKDEEKKEGEAPAPASEGGAAAAPAPMEEDPAQAVQLTLEPVETAEEAATFAGVRERMASRIGNRHGGGRGGGGRFRGRGRQGGRRGRGMKRSRDD